MIALHCSIIKTDIIVGFFASFSMTGWSISSTILSLADGRVVDDIFSYRNDLEWFRQFVEIWGILRVLAKNTGFDVLQLRYIRLVD